MRSLFHVDTLLAVTTRAAGRVAESWVSGGIIAAVIVEEAGGAKVDDRFHVDWAWGVRPGN